MEGVAAITVPPFARPVFKDLLIVSRAGMGYSQHCSVLLYLRK